MIIYGRLLLFVAHSNGDDIFFNLSNSFCVREELEGVVKVWPIKYLFKFQLLFN